MIINHNIAALNTYRQLSVNNSLAAKSLEKLSSGLRINRAADDAAGLAISEKMRGQIRGLNQAVRNAQDTISLIQTAEGGLNEIHSILQRMRELAVQASNDTNTPDDRNEIQKEINQLISEIDRIATTTEFNTKKLLNGNASGIAVISGEDKIISAYLDGDNNVTGQFKVNVITAGVAEKEATSGAMDASETAVSWTDKTVDNTFADVWGTGAFGGNEAIKIEQEVNGVTRSVVVNISGSMKLGEFVNIANQKLQEAGMNVTVSFDASQGGLIFSSTKVGTSNEITVTDLNWDGSAVLGNTTTQNAVDAVVELENVTTGVTTASVTVSDDLVAIDNDANTGLNGVRIELTQTALMSKGPDIARVEIGKGGLVAQIGANENQEMSINIKNMSANVLGVDSGVASFGSIAALRDVGMTTQSNASSAITVIDKAIKDVSAERAKLGAYQNRLEHTIANLGTAAENITAAESRIRDIDMAKEMMEFTKMSILQQAATAMLEVLAA